MKIYTSYFGKLPVLRQLGIVPICISRGVPKFYGGACNNKVAPYSWMLKDGVSREQYIDAFKNKVLKSVDPVEFLHECEAIGEGQDVALLCYEKPTDFCHRHLVADWLENETGIIITEFGVTGRPWEHKNPDVEQGSLFD